MYKFSVLYDWQGTPILQQFGHSNPTRTRDTLYALLGVVYTSCFTTQHQYYIT
jgi:hypothetical protein